MSDFWIVSVSDRAYGPYTTPQMEGFIGEGRIAPSSLIARAGETEFSPAGAEPAFSALFQPSKSAAVVQSMKPAEPAAAQKFGRDLDAKTGERSRYVVIADMKSRSIQGLEEELHKLGQAHALFPQVWLVTSELSVNTLRNQLIQQLGKLDTLFVVDSTHDKAAWFNFGPEADARIRKLWTKDAPQAFQAFG
jgi:hypothetical protein